MTHDASSPGKESRQLNALFVGGFDSTNYAYVELVHEFVARGHVCTVIVENERDVVNNKMFARAGISTVPLSQFSASDLEPVDFVFSGPYLRRPYRALFDAIYEQRKFLVSFANLFSSVTMRVAPDLVITTGEGKYEDFADNGLDYNMVAVGNPQYDPLVRARHARPRVALGDIRKVLVVDQGAYPFGDVGKGQLAQTLVRIAENNPQMVFHIKPRYLPHEDGDHLHSVSDHLYSYLKNTPENLVLIHESTILEELVLEYDAMITTWSTAHLDAAALGMPLLLIGGIDSVDVFDVRKQRVAAAYEHLRDSGCLVDWRELQEGPCPFAYVSEEYIAQELYDASAPCSPNVVSLMEKIDSAVRREGRAFIGGFHLAYAEFMRTVGELETLDAASEENRVNRLLFRTLNASVQNLVFDHRYMGYALDMRRMLPFWEMRLGPDATAQDVERIVGEARDTGLQLKEAFFSANPEAIACDVFVQDHYFDWLRSTGRIGELFTYAGPVVVPASLEFNRGMAHLKRARPFLAARMILESFSISLQQPSRIIKKDKDIKVLLSRTDVSPLAHAILFFLNRYKKYDALSMLDIPARPNLDALVYYKMKALVALDRREDAKALAKEYVAATEHKTAMTQSATLKQRALLAVIGGYRALRRRYASRLH